MEKVDLLLAISLSHWATPAACQYNNQYYDHDKKQIDGFPCDVPKKDTDSEFCIFHDINYLKGDNYEKNKKEVVNRFKRKLSKYSSNNMPLRFFGYCLPEISFSFKIS